MNLERQTFAGLSEAQSAVAIVQTTRCHEFNRPRRAFLRCRAAGIDRLAMLLERLPAGAPSVMIISGEQVVEVAAYLRKHGIKTEIAFQNNLKNGLKYANRSNAQWAVIVNPDSLIVKNLSDGSQAAAVLTDLPKILRQ